ncbi:hypothetical protein [Halohasta salina]|uniref:hypothetical protein n=1 Tax=Halohasta salina TaxID=2961621 RepID=UPI0020A49B3A|nr:hypothetical protein [Halohasta salina]
MTESIQSPAELSSLDYRLESYAGLLRSFREAGYEFGSFEGGRPAPGEILLRHDVDLSLDRALAMAERERELGVASTYCVLLSAPVYDLTRPRNLRLLGRIVDLGHDLALHFDTHRYWSPTADPGRAVIEAKATDELDVLGRLVGETPSTVSFHIPPEWTIDRSFEPFTSTYAPAFFSEIGYRSDSSQKWRSTDPFGDTLPERLQLLVHPGLWHADGRPMGEIVDERRRRCYGRVDDFFDPLDAAAGEQ